MKRRIFMSLLISATVLLGLSLTMHQKVVMAYRTNTKNQDTTKFKEIILGNNKLVDLKFCVENFEYPPNLSKHIYWTKPDISGLSNFEKNNLAFKYNFDKDGKLTMYYYQGSRISGIAPIPYFFKYDRNKTYLITEIIDGDLFNKTKYRVTYDSLMNIQCIEKLDSLNKRLEILKIKIIAHL